VTSRAIPSSRTGAPSAPHTRCARLLYPAHALVREHDPVLDLVTLAGAQRRPRLLDAREIGRVDDPAPQLDVRGEFLGRVPEHDARRGAHVDQLRLGQRNRPHGIGQRFEKRVHPLVQRVEAHLHRRAAPPGRRVAQRPRHRGRQADQVRLQHVVGRAILQRADSVFLAERPGNEHERSVRSQIARDLQRRQPSKPHIEKSDRITSGSNSNSAALNASAESTTAPVDPHARALELTHRTTRHRQRRPRRAGSAP
jgi:hypothetical protein